MELTIVRKSALQVLRALRQGMLRGAPMRAGNIPAHDLDGSVSATTGRLARALRPLCDAGAISLGDGLELAVPNSAQRVRSAGVHSTVYSAGAGALPDGAFYEASPGIWASSPELLFVEMASRLSPAEHLVLGLELCGTFSRHALEPRNGAVAYGIEPATTVAKLREFMGGLRYVHGLGPARQTLDRLEDNAWSPMEAIIAALCLLPVEELGYGMWPLRLNERVATSLGMAGDDLATRVPDIMFPGTGVGLNYDGDGHLDLRRVVLAAQEELLHPESASSQDAVARAMREVRRKSIDDRRRDRELMAQGMDVMVVTYEDLVEFGALDRLMLQIILAIEHGGPRDLSHQREVLRSGRFSRARQDLVWSLLPTGDAEAAARRVAHMMDPQDGGWTVDGEMSF